jgi:hypothetical protein
MSEHSENPGVEEAASEWRGASWQDAADDVLLRGHARTFRARLRWNQEMVAMWARWHPELARKILIERYSIHSP